MSKTLLRKFGVKHIFDEYRELICKECGARAGEHYDDGKICPSLSQLSPNTRRSIHLPEYCNDCHHRTVTCIERPCETGGRNE